MPRPKGSPNKLTSEIKERLSQVIMNAMSTIDIDSMTQNERLKLIQIGLTYIVPKLRPTQEINEVPGNTTRDPESNLPQLYIEDSAINEFNIENPFIGSNLKSSGFDIGASYVWDTNRFGQFTLSSKTTYVQDFENNDSLLELINIELGDPADRVVSPELQSSLMLTWEFGNHTTTAITNYFDSFKDISELDLDEINALVDDIITVDLQYGYSVETGNNDRAIISFGIRNIFNERTAQILNSNTRILDQNGRVAYGSIKYQF